MKKFMNKSIKFIIFIAIILAIIYIKKYNNDREEKIKAIDSTLFSQTNPTEGQFECEELLTKFTFRENFVSENCKPYLYFNGNEKTIDGEVDYVYNYVEDVLYVTYNSKKYHFKYDRDNDYYAYKGYIFERID